MLTVEPELEKFVERNGEWVRRENGLHVGEYARVEWRTDLDVPASGIEVEHGPDLEVVSDVEKENAGMVNGKERWTYAVRVRVGSIRTEVQLSVPGERVESTSFSAHRALT
jgi:hypothetical protein